MLFSRPGKPFPQTPAGSLFLHPVLLGDIKLLQISLWIPTSLLHPTHSLLFPHSCPVAVEADFITEIMSGPEWALGQLLNEQREWGEAGGGAAYRILGAKSLGKGLGTVGCSTWRHMEPGRGRRGLRAEVQLRSDLQSFERHQWSLLQNSLLKIPSHTHSTVCSVSPLPASQWPS